MDSGTIDFINMADGTREEYELLERHYRRFTDGLPERLMTHLSLLSGDLMGYKIDRFQHSLQTATRAHREGAEEEMVVAALLHDIGDTISPENHSELGASVLQP